MMDRLTDLLGRGVASVEAIRADVAALAAAARELTQRTPPRPLGPHSYVSEEEAAAETGHGLEAVRGALARRRSEVPHTARRCGPGELRRWRWEEVQRVLAEELGGGLGRSLALHSPAAAQPDPAAVEAVQKRDKDRRWDRLAP